MKIRLAEMPTTAAMVLAMAACADAGGSPPLAETRDSAGIRIVENRGAGWAGDARWRVGEPLLTIGGLNAPPEAQLYDIQGATRLSDGRLVVANAGSNELRYYDLSGEFLESVGQGGEGPGEFGYLHSLARTNGDSLLVWDSRNRRVSYHDPDGVFQRTYKLESGSGGLIRFAGMSLVAFPDGAMLGLEAMRGVADAEPGVFRDTAHFFLFDSEGREVAPVGAFPWREIYLGTGQTRMANGRAMREMAPLFFGKNLHLTAGDSTFWVGTGDVTLSRVDRRGRVLQRIRRLDLARIPVTPELVADQIGAYMAAEETHGHDEAFLDARRKLFQGMPAADTVPAYRNMLTDSGGNLWVEEHPGVEDPEQPSRWDVFGPTGRFLGTVELPASFAPFEVGEDYVLGVRTDAMELEHLEMLPLTRGMERP